MQTDQFLGNEDLRSSFIKTSPVEELIGIEVEMPLVDPETGISFSYDADHGAHALLDAFRVTGDWTPVYDESHLVELRAPNGEKIKVEHGGAVEYCSPPMRSVTRLIEGMHRTLADLASAAREMGAALLAGSYMPFNRFEDTRWTPSVRGKIMRDYFSHLNRDDNSAARIMALSTSTQATIDYVSEEDLCTKIQSLAVISPVASAIFLNSPLEEGKFCNVLSRRMQLYFHVDPRRSGFLPPAFQETMTLNDFIDWAIEVPMIFRAKEGQFLPAHGLPFSHINRQGFPDGIGPSLRDWTMHCAQIFTDTRVRNTVELRCLDGPAFPEIPSVPAFWTGLAYHPASLDEAKRLMKGIRLFEHQQVLKQIVYKGLQASYKNFRVQDLAIELVRLAREGLEARCRAGIESPEALSYLDPLEEIVRSGKTLAEHQLELWDGELARSPARFVEKFRI